jgi:hypothetical protein
MSRRRATERGPVQTSEQRRCARDAPEGPVEPQEFRAQRQWAVDREDIDARETGSRQQQTEAFMREALEVGIGRMRPVQRCAAAVDDDGV